ncbi:MAG: hypothetical protein Fur006_43590 [Coleofasciculaceae cyanobacterium]
MSFAHRLFWSIILVLSSLACTISIALAESVERNLILNSDGSESFETLLRQAQDLAQDLIEEEFAQNLDVNEVSIVISGEHQGQIVPLLRSQVSRSQWQQDSRMPRWTRYFANNSRVLLGFNKPAAPPTAQLDPAEERRRRIENDPAYRDD